MRESKLDAGFTYLGRIDECQVVQGVLSALHMIAWKFIVIAFTRVETNNEKYDAKKVWRQTVGRLNSRVRAYGERVARRAARREWQGNTGLAPGEVERHCSVLAPLAEVNEFGALSWTPLARELGLAQ